MEERTVYAMDVIWRENGVIVGLLVRRELDNRVECQMNQFINIAI